MEENVLCCTNRKITRFCPIWLNNQNISFIPTFTKVNNYLIKLKFHLNFTSHPVYRSGADIFTERPFH